MRKRTLIRDKCTEDGRVIVPGNFDENNPDDLRAYRKVNHKRKTRNTMVKNSRRINRGK